MNPQNDSFVMVQGEIGQWEHAINCYNGPDPLDLWFRYICWLETNSKSVQGIEEKFRKAVEQCLSLYDKYENYKQDLRMVKLWIKYIDFQPNKPNLYKILYQQGIGTKCAAFYIAWAHYYNYYNSDNSLKQAESIYNLGLQLKAEPLHELENAQKNFRYSVAQRMLYNDESSKKRTISSLAEQREQITSLSPHPNNQPSQPALKRARTESSSSEYGHHSEMSSNSGYSSPYNSQNSATNGYVQPTQSVSQQSVCTQNVPQPEHSQTILLQQQQSQPQYSNHQNYYQQPNETGYAMNTSMNMTNQYAYDESLNSYSSAPVQQAPANYTFDCGFQKPLNFINYARNSHEPWDGLLFLEEPYDSNRRCFYPKNQVYPGDGCEYSLEELMANKWRIKMEEKRKREELEKIRLEQERLRQEAERIRQEQEAKRLREEQEVMRLKMEQQKIEAERIRKQQEEENRRYQMYQQQQHQQWNAYQSPVSYSSPAYHYQHSPYENSPQYSYAHDHQYQTHFQAQPTYQHSPHSFQNSPSYHQMPTNHQSVIVNRSQYENHQQHNYYQSYAPHQQQQVPPQQQHGYVENTYQYSQHMQMQTQIKYSEQSQVLPQPKNASNTPNVKIEEPDYQDVEYLIDHQAEIDPRMLKQPIVEGNEEDVGASESASSDSDESDEQIPTIVNSYMLDDLEEQIEASTISFSSNGKSRDKKITIKFRKEKTIIANSESNSSSSQQRLKVPLEPTSTSSSQSSNKKKKNKKVELLSSFDGENTQFMPSATNSNSSTHNGDQNIGKITFNGCITPVRKQAASKTSTPVSSYKFLKNKSSFLSHNDESFTGDQNSFFQAENDDEFKSRRLDKALATIDEHFNKRDIDPFNSELCRAFLTKINFPMRDNKEGYKVISTNLPKFAKNQMVPIGGINYQLEKEVGRGSYGYVYRGVNLYDGSVVALKYQRASNLSTWEMYICTEVKKRIKNADILPGFMTISAAVIAPNASVLISEFSQYGSLLDINNRIRTSTTKVMHESLAMHFSSQILSIVAHLHDCKIIHADIKPDNFLLMTLPSADDHIPSLRLIDFGCAIDMTFFKEGQEFRKIIETDGFTCVEMQEGRTWSYQTDLFCIAGTIHVMLFGEYMQVNKNFGHWDIKQKFPRYLNKTLWTDVFSKLLNIKDGNNLPNLRHMKAKVDRDINDNELVKHIRTLNNLIRKR